MDFHPTEEHAAAAGLAARIFGDLATHDRLAAAGTGSDAELWKALTAAGLTAAVEDIGLLGLVLLLEEQGRTTAQVPYAATCVYGIHAVAGHGSAEQRARLLPALGTGEAVATGAFPARGRITASPDGRITGTAPAVPWLREATHVLVPDAEQTLWLVRTDAPGVRTRAVETTAPWSAGRLTLTGAQGERLGGADAYGQVLAAARTAFAGLQAGVCAGALARAVEYTSTREQFGRPLSTNQGVMLRAADAYMDTEAIRVTAYEAAWRIDEGLPAREHALTAAWWASEAGKRVVHAGQHLHGGMGADLDHPVHRHFLWGRQLDAYLGCGSELLAELGALLAGETAVTGESAPPDETAATNATNASEGDDA
ncbi:MULTISPECIES: acyl-CoA dehydrogenase family protein [unclassified Streptomyces]|uniref:acyl-CoA dehydrogenase family protein n=1 Tax=unclassified Streptomyces TaxID=2593676 RepID=UPI001BEC0C46|nr:MULTISPECIES: acyl-CoA dehydrogenase family protein [unclassified Streptomyces]MBT2402848.1 acyl-CoA dehydrogenase family protein [Streptomyces sp. ISL-21]MBT2607193.1 acyl-CoA dehydrogenase family protein [Streptomyces sp. ISL-87]